LIQGTFSPQPPLQLSHLTGVGLVIVTQEVQKAVKGQDPKLNCEGVSVLPGLTSGDPGGDGDVPQLRVGTI